MSERIPTLDAHFVKGRGRDCDLLKVWCDHCLTFHTHGRADGHRVEHCGCRNSPYEDTGYNIREVGPFDAAIRSAHREQSKQRGRNLRRGKRGCGCDF